jgi:hypothetical protein
MGCQFYGVSIDAVKGQIHNEAGAPTALGNTAKRRDPKAAKVLEASRQQSSLTAS